MHPLCLLLSHIINQTRQTDDSFYANSVYTCTTSSEANPIKTMTLCHSVDTLSNNMFGCKIQSKIQHEKWLHYNIQRISWQKVKYTNKIYKFQWIEENGTATTRCIQPSWCFMNWLSHTLKSLKGNISSEFFWHQQECRKHNSIQIRDSTHTHWVRSTILLALQIHYSGAWSTACLSWSICDSNHHHPPPLYSACLTYLHLNTHSNWDVTSLPTQTALVRGETWRSRVRLKPKKSDNTAERGPLSARPHSIVNTSTRGEEH